MIVVADSSPLVVLTNLNEIEILPKLFGSVLIPPDVLAELAAPRRPAAVRVFAAGPPSWLVVQAPHSIENIPGLHPGERAAISLAAEVKADLLLMDEKDGRRAALQRHLRITGTVGVLERAAEENLLDLKTTFERLKATDFWIDAELLDTERVIANVGGQADVRPRLMEYFGPRTEAAGFIRTTCPRTR